MSRLRAPLAELIAARERAAVRRRRRAPEYSVAAIEAAARLIHERREKVTRERVAAELRVDPSTIRRQLDREDRTWQSVKDALLAEN